MGQPVKQFKVGDEFEHRGVRYRVLAGDRTVGDMVLEINIGSGWYRPTISHTLILAAFKFQVEENNYPRPRYRGGYKLIAAITEACKYGWQDVAERIELERSRRNVRRDNIGDSTSLGASVE